MRRTETTYSEAGLIIARDYERCMSTLCRHVSNDKYYGKPFLIEPFQRENIWKPIFATGEVVDGRFERRFRRAIIGLPSGYGKTELASALLLTIATMEPIYNGQYGLVASSLDQVSNLLSKISTMIKLDPTLDSQWTISKSAITHDETGAKIMVLPNKPDALESWHFNVLIFDELHVYRDSRTWDAGLKGQKVLDQPLTIGITTAGDRRDGFLWQTLERADNDPGLYLYWLGLDDSDDINSRKVWEKLMCASWVTWDSIQDQRGMASTPRAFERYTANRFPKDNAADACFTANQIKACAKGSNDFDFSRPFTLGIDGATSGDSFAIIAYQEHENSRGNIMGYTREWVFDDPGDDGRYNMSQILELVATIYQEHYPEVVGIDPNRLIVFASQLKDNYGVPIVSFAQNNATMCSASALTINAVKHNRVKLKGCPKLTEQLANTVALEREPYGVRFGKDAKRSKIDAPIALAIAQLAYEKLVRGTEDMVEPF